MKLISMAPSGENAVYQNYEVADLIEQLASFMLMIEASSNFPALPVLNDLFSKGEFDEGMSGGVQWIVFALTEQERLEIKREISIKYKINFVDNEVLDSLKTYADWFNKSLKFSRSKG